jgi:hypothetical protein
MAEQKMRNSYSMGREDFEMLKEVRTMLRAPTDSEAIRQALEEIHDRLSETPKGRALLKAYRAAERARKKQETEGLD